MTAPGGADAHALALRRVLSHGRLWLALAVVLMALAAARIGERLPLDRTDGTLVAIDAARIHELEPARAPYVVALPERGLRDRRELVRLRAVSSFELEAAPSRGPWRLYAEHLNDGGRWTVNGTIVADLPATSQHATVRQLGPSRFDLPPGLLRAGTNVIEREWAIHENMLLMPRMAVGEAARIDAIFAPRDLAYRVLPGVTLVVAWGLALIMFAIHLGNRDLKAYLWVAISGVGFGIIDLVFFVSTIPAGLFPYWRLALFAAGCGLLLGINYFLLDVSGVQAPRYRRWTLALSALLCATYLAYHLATGNTFQPVFPRAILLLAAGFSLLPLATLLRSLLKRFEWHRAGLLLVVGVGIWINTVDLSAADLSRSAVQSGYLLQLFALVWFATAGGFLITDFSRSLAAQRGQAATLTRELAVQKAELSRLHALERTARAAEAAALERSRILQDMHDGLGSQLVSSLAMARAGELSSQQTYELLRSCIDDLRLAIDGLQDVPDSLLLALGNLRFRMQPRLRAAGIALHWDTQQLDPSPPLRPQDHLPILRIVQESLTNALKHASPKTITLKATRVDGALEIRIHDDGRGFDVQAAKASATGKGLNGLEKRARLLGATLQVTSCERGSAIWLQVPLAPRQGADTPAPVP